MKAIILTIGSEITGGRTVDTNAAWLADDLERHGARVAAVLSAPDSLGEIGSIFRFALQQNPDLVVVAGGLGPTADDLTASALAGELGFPLELNQLAARLVAKAVQADVRQLEPHSLKQATLPAGSEVLVPVGTAPGFIFESDGTQIAVLPGMPLELKQMWAEARESKRLRPLLSHPARKHKKLCFYGTGEPEVEAAVDEILKETVEPKSADLEVAICSLYGEITLDISYPQEAQEKAAQLVASLKDRLGDYVYSDGESISEVIGLELGSRSLTLAVSESCTGGMLGADITAVSGSSAYFRGGIIAYDNQVKKNLLKVSREILDNTGAVSEPVAQQMAVGVRALIGADYGIGVTGIAGPTGGTPDKPVGLVYICVSSIRGDAVERFNFPGGREDVRRASVIASLHVLHKVIIA